MTYLELEEILLEDKPSYTLKKREEELFELIPELGACKGFDQYNKEWHPYDVLEHTYHVVDGIENNISNKLTLRLTALFHDIGKVATRTIDSNGVGHFKGHWVESEKIFGDFADKHSIDKVTKEVVAKLIRYHDANFNVLNNLPQGELSRDEIIMLYRIKKADILAQNPEKHEQILDRNELDEEELLMRK